MGGSEGGAFNPLQRIVGAVVLVVLAVIFLPMIVRPRPVPRPPVAAPGAPSAAQVPAAAARSGTQAPVPTPAPTPAPTPVAKSGPAAGALAAPPATTPAVKMQPVPLVSRTHPWAPAAPPAARPQAAGDQWFVQVASLANLHAARRLQQRLAHAGFRVRLAHAGRPHRPLYRVQVGPYDRRAAAVVAQRRVAHTAHLARTWVTRARR